MSSDKDKHSNERIEISAPVYIPSKDDLAVGLVRSDLVYRLEEYRTDERRWESVMWASIGAILALIVNWATAETINISKSSLLLLAILSLTTLATWAAASDFKKRAEKMKERVLSVETKARAESIDLSDEWELKIIETQIGHAKTVPPRDEARSS